MVSIIRFPGTNCDFDTQYAFEKFGCKTKIIWHEESALPTNTKLVVLAGGFSYGDYLRSGAIAKVSKIMQDVKQASKKGIKILGICNGFQILTETHLLEGSLIRNKNLHFISKNSYLKIQNNDNDFLTKYAKNDVIKLPVAHADGNYKCDNDTLKSLQDNNQILMTYCDKNGNDVDLNGSINHIAGICNKEKNIFGLMPHPERAVEEILGSCDGLNMLESLI